MAADRDNPQVAALCDPLNPAVLRVLKRVIGRAPARASRSPCAARWPAGRCACSRCFGMGLRRVSMSPAFVPAIKELVRSVTTVDARRTARAVLRMQTAAEVRAYLTDRLRKLCPQVANVDTT